MYIVIKETDLNIFHHSQPIIQLRLLQCQTTLSIVCQVLEWVCKIQTYLSSSVLNITQIIQYKVPGIGPKLNEMMLEIHTNASANDLITENSKIDKPWYKTTELKLYVAQIHR